MQLRKIIQEEAAKALRAAHPNIEPKDTAKLNQLGARNHGQHGESLIGGIFVNNISAKTFII